VQCFAKSARLDPDDGIRTGIEILAPREHVDGDDVGLDALAPSGGCLLDDKAEKLAIALGRMEAAVRDNALQLSRDLYRRRIRLRPIRMIAASDGSAHARTSPPKFTQRKAVYATRDDNQP